MNRVHGGRQANRESFWFRRRIGQCGKPIRIAKLTPARGSCPFAMCTAGPPSTYIPRPDWPIAAEPWFAPAAISAMLAASVPMISYPYQRDVAGASARGCACAAEALKANANVNNTERATVVMPAHQQAPIQRRLALKRSVFRAITQKVCRPLHGRHGRVVSLRAHLSNRRGCRAPGACTPYTRLRWCLGFVLC